MQRKGSKQLGGSGDKGGGGAAAAAAGGGANGSGSNGSSTIRAVPSQKQLQPRPWTAGSKGSKDGIEGLQICGGKQQTFVLWKYIRITTKEWASWQC